MDSLFLDTSFAVALASPRDMHHEAAVRWARQIRASARRLITHTGVLFEIGNGLAGVHERESGAQILTALAESPDVETVHADSRLTAEALDLYRSRPDKGWGLVDCASFVLMERRGITGALTADRHFEQAGFQALLREAP